jgi:hypothetical protein
MSQNVDVFLRAKLVEKRNELDPYPPPDCFQFRPISPNSVGLGLS